MTEAGASHETVATAIYEAFAKDGLDQAKVDPRSSEIRSARPLSYPASQVAWTGAQVGCRLREGLRSPTGSGGSGT